MTMTALEEVVTGEIVRTADEWAEVLTEDIGRTVQAHITFGLHLTQAKVDVGHGGWLPLLASIGVSSSGAHRYMVAAERFANFPSLGNLPPSSTALAELAALTPGDIESGIESGEVHPGMTIKDAKGYVAEVADRVAPANVNTDTGEIGPEPETPKRDRAEEKAEREVSIVNDLRLYLRHIGTEKTILGMSDSAKQYVIEALEEAATNLKESM